MAKKEILYRAKSKANGEWLYGHVFEEFFYRFKEGWGKEWVLQPIREKVTDAGCRQVVDANTICEYTGLHDKNGTKIFDGDIIQGTITSQWNKRLINCEVVYENGCFISVETDGHHWVHKLKFAKNIEVIGNKFDNPELLLEVEE